MIVRCLFVVLLFVVFTAGLTPPCSYATELSKEELLDKAQDALIWFYKLGDEVIQNRTPAEKYREKISPIELIQAAAFLHSYHLNEQTGLAEKLLLMLPYHRLTQEEMFEINDVLGETDLRNLAEIATPLLVSIPVEAARFRRDSLNNAEKIILYQEPASALELMKAVDVLSGVGRPVLVRHYLRKFLRGGQYEAMPEESATIVETIGTQKLMQLAIHPEFVPLGKEAVAKIIEEAKKHWQSSERIADALKETQWFTEGDGSRELATVSPRVRPEALPALQVLWKGDQLSVQKVFEKLETIEDEREADELTAILLSLRPDMKEALAIAMSSTNPKLRYHVARSLAASVTPLDSFLLYPFLYIDDLFIEGQKAVLSESEREAIKNTLQQRGIAVPNQEQAATILFERGNDYFERRRPLRTDADGLVTYWLWAAQGDEECTAKYRQTDLENGYRHFAHQYYQLSYDMMPKTSANYRNCKFACMIARLEMDGKFYQYEFAYDPILSIRDDPNEMELLLQMCLEKERFDAADAAVYRLGQIGNPDLLNSTNGKPRVLVQATVAKDRGVRFSALEAIMNITATQSPALKPFAGSSLVAETLAWFSKSEGENRMLAGHPQMSSAVQTANLFLGLGYTTDVATTCRELFQKAATSPDVEMVFVDVRTTQPPVGEFVQMMRQDARTAEIPIAILGNDHPVLSDTPPREGNYRRNEMARVERQNPDAPFQTSLSLTYPRLANEDAARWVRDDLLEKTGSPLHHINNPHMGLHNWESVRAWARDSAQRLEQAKQALGWLREIKEAELESGMKIYHFEDFDAVVLDALHSERRVKEGLALAAVVKSPMVQSALHEMATNAVYPIWLREQAGEALEENVERFGKLRRVRN